VEQAELGRDREAESRGGTAQPRHIGDQRHAIPAAEMAHAELGVVPHRAGVEAGEIVGGDVQQAQLAIERKRRLHIRHDDAFVIRRRDLSMGAEAQCAGRQSFDLCDHGRSPSMTSRTVCPAPRENRARDTRSWEQELQAGSMCRSSSRGLSRPCQSLMVSS
jgi:hypothetical protein